MVAVGLHWTVVDVVTDGAFVVLLSVAYATTHRPHPNAIAEQLKGTDTPKKKYE